MKIVFALLAAFSVSAFAQTGQPANKAEPKATEPAKTEAAKPDAKPEGVKSDAKPADTVKPGPSATPAAAPAAVVPLTLKPTDKLPEKVTQLVIIDRALGDGRAAAERSGVLVHYTGWLYDPSKPEGKGQQFDSSVTRVTPFGFMIGAGRVIKGWDVGVQGMKIKGKRTLIIPADLAYGTRSTGPIPPNSTLIFDIELMDILN